MNKFYNIHSLWLVMMLLTLITYAMAKLEYSGTMAMLFLLLTAALKAGWITRDYMELRSVSLLWRIIMYGWVLTVCTTTGITYLISL